MATPGEVHPPVPGHGRVAVGIGLVFLFALVGGTFRLAGTPSDERAVVGDWGTVAFVLVVAAPGVLAIVGMRRRPWLLVAAAGLLLPLCFLSFSFLFFPLAIPSALFVIDAATRPRGNHRRGVQGVAAILGALFVIAALLSLFAHQDPVHWTTATGSGDVSDVITEQEALTAIGFLVAALAVALLSPADDPVVVRRVRRVKSVEARPSLARIWLRSIVEVAYVATVAILAVVATNDPNDVAGRVLVVAVVLTLPSFWVLAPVAYLVIAGVWNATGADHGGPTWPVTTAYVVLLIAAAVLNVVFASMLVDAHARRRAARVRTRARG